MTDEDLDQSDERRAWFASPHTQRVIKAQRVARDAALAHLIGRCAVSTDPSVRAAHGAYEELVRLVKELEK
jgi:hypothetical protein